MVLWLVLLSVLVGLGRFTVPGHSLSYAGSYEAFAHIWIGFLFGVMVLSREYRKIAILLFIVLAVLETVMFLLR